MGIKLTSFKQKIQEHFDSIAKSRGIWRKKNAYYYSSQERYLKFLIPEGMRVLEIGCGRGDLLDALKPKLGIGIDLSGKMIEFAKAKYPNLEFYQADAEDNSTWPFEETFDFIIIADTIGLLEDLQIMLEQVRHYCNSDTRLIVSYYNFHWEPILRIGQKLGLKMPQPEQNWFSSEDIENLLYLTNFDVVKKDNQLLLPKYIPLLSKISEFFGQMPIVNKLCISNYIVARPLRSSKSEKNLSVSVIIPCKNERGNIEPAVQRIPKLGSHTEIIFIDGHSKDGTPEEIMRVIKEYPDLDIRFMVQDGTGKGDAVRKAFASAKNELLMILDADLTVPPEDLIKFYRAIANDRGEFINGCRLVYPMEQQAMRLLNYFGNKFFSLAFSWLLNQRIKDTLCGTKVLTKKNYSKIAANREYFGDFDPFGDFDLIFGASKLNLSIVEVPIRYRSREYGETQISRLRHGLLLLRMCFFAAKKLKMV